jgi:hypothetical protein
MGSFDEPQHGGVRVRAELALAERLVLRGVGRVDADAELVDESRELARDVAAVDEIAFAIGDEPDLLAFGLRPARDGLHRVEPLRRLPVSAEDHLVVLFRLAHREKDLVDVRLVLEAGYEDYVKENYTHYRSRLEDLQQLAAFAMQFEALEDFLSQLALMTNVEAEEDRPAPAEDEQVRFFGHYKLAWRDLLRIEDQFLAFLLMSDLAMPRRLLACVRLVRQFVGQAVGRREADRVAADRIARTRTMGAYKASTLIDFERGLPLELESMFLEPLRRAQAAGVPVPRLTRLCDVLRQLNPAH